MNHFNKIIQKLNNNTINPTAKTIIVEETIQTNNLIVSENLTAKNVFINGEKSNDINSGALVIDGGLGVTENINTKDIKVEKIYLSDTLYIYAKGDELWIKNTLGEYKIL